MSFSSVSGVLSKQSLFTKDNMSGYNDEVPSYFGHLVEHLKETKR